MSKLTNYVQSNSDQMWKTLNVLASPGASVWGTCCSSVLLCRARPSFCRHRSDCFRLP